MIYVLFEVVIKKDSLDAYMALAAGLKNELEQAQGFIRSERFKSIAHEGKVLSLSVWENEESVNKWRNALNHRMSQQQGWRNSLFESFTITVSSKIRSYTLTDWHERPEDSQVFFAASPGAV